MGLFSSMKENADRKIRDFIISLLIEGETLEMADVAGSDWYAITNKRVIVYDQELKLLGDSGNEIVSFERKAVRTIIVEIPISGIIKKYKLCFRCDSISAKVTFYDKDRCMESYKSALPFIY